MGVWIKRLKCFPSHPSLHSSEPPGGRFYLHEEDRRHLKWLQQSEKQHSIGVVPIIQLTIVQWLETLTNYPHKKSPGRTYDGFFLAPLLYCPLSRETTLHLSWNYQESTLKITVTSTTIGSVCACLWVFVVTLHC